jgi:hypothetical protein
VGYKIVQWATGKMGACCLRAILEHDDLELVGVRVYIDDPLYAFDILGFGSEIGSIDPNDDSWAPAAMINGLPSLGLSLNLSSNEDYPKTGSNTFHDVEISIGQGVAGSVINSIPLMCAAPPGVPRIPMDSHFMKSFNSQGIQ